MLAHNSAMCTLAHTCAMCTLAHICAMCVKRHTCARGTLLVPLYADCRKRAEMCASVCEVVYGWMDDMGGRIWIGDMGGGR